MSQLTLKGSCLCGAVKYEVTGDPQRFYHCHCSRCRKSSGTGHATNILMTQATLAFSHGEPRLKRFKLPGAERFSRQFCTECGSPVARVVPALNAVVIPAGSLDDHVPIKPQGRIYWDSRTDWTCDGDTLPRFPEGPSGLLPAIVQGPAAGDG
ncbi:MAG: GFA family protein [Acidiferrobacter sp.]